MAVGRAGSRTGSQRRGHRIDVDAGARRAAALDGAAYAAAFTISLPSSVATGASASPEPWARAVFEGAPSLLRWGVVFGWRAVLWLRLNFDAADYVLGWTIVDRSAACVVLEARSPLLTARKVVQVSDSRLTATTFVRFERRWGRWVWAVVAPVHHRTEPLLLTLAARRGVRSPV